MIYPSRGWDDILLFIFRNEMVSFSMCWCSLRCEDLIPDSQKNIIQSQKKFIQSLFFFRLSQFLSNITCAFSTCARWQRAHWFNLVPYTSHLSVVGRNRSSILLCDGKCSLRYISTRGTLVSKTFLEIWCLSPLLWWAILWSWHHTSSTSSIQLRFLLVSRWFDSQIPSSSLHIRNLSSPVTNRYNCYRLVCHSLAFVWDNQTYAGYRVNWSRYLWIHCLSCRSFLHHRYPW